jgi:ABC-2 type transport system permease protein
MNRMGTVIKFTFMNKVRTKSFVITTLIFALLVSIALNVPYFIDKFSSGSDSDKTVIGIVYENQPEIATSFKAYTDQQALEGYSFVDIKEKTSKEDLQQQIKDGKIQGYLTFGEADASGFPVVNYTSEDSSIGNNLQVVLQAALENVKTQYITKGSLSSEQIAQLNTPVKIEALKLQDSGTDQDSGAGSDGSEKQNVMNYVAVYLLLFLFFMTSMMTGNMIASEVTAEKSSRIMEILITSVSPLSQMFGKIIAMFLLGILQIGIFIGVIALNIMLPHNSAILANFNLDLSQLNASVIWLGLLFYILGYFLYATLFAAIGSMVSRTEELGQAIMPITMLSLAAFYIGMFSITAPNSMLLKVSTYIPFISPTSNLVRIGLGDIAPWEIIVSLVILVISIFFFGWLSAKIYRTGVLLYGKRPSFKELRKAMKAYKI